MSNYPIRGGQLAPPIQENNAQPECIRACKRYDWVGVPVEEHIFTAIPSNCLPQILSVKNLEIFCCPLPQEGRHDFEVISIRRNLPGLPESAALVSVCCTFLIRLALVDGDRPECPICCIEAPVTFMLRRVVVCLPEPLGRENISCEVLCCEVLGGISCDGNELDIELILSIGLIVETEVILEVVGKFCQPRLPITPPTTFCPIGVDFPQQCNSFFPSPSPPPPITCCTTVGVVIDPPATAIPCSGPITGTVTCDGVPAAGREVTLTATGPVTFSPNPAVTNAAGVFLVTASTPPIGSDTITITATSAICGVVGSDQVRVVFTCGD